MIGYYVGYYYYIAKLLKEKVLSCEFFLEQGVLKPTHFRFPKDPTRMHENQLLIRAKAQPPSLPCLLTDCLAQQPTTKYPQVLYRPLSLDLPSAPERLQLLQAEEEDSGVMRRRRRRGGGGLTKLLFSDAGWEPGSPSLGVELL